MTFRRAAARSARDAFELLPEAARQTVRNRYADVRGLGHVKRNQALLAQRLAALEAEARSPEAEVPDPRFPEGVRSRACTQAQFEQPSYAQWCARLGEPARTNRKQWEHILIASAASALGVLAPGRRAVGFGVGQEPLVAYFAGQGVEVLATDLDPGDAGSRVWHNTGQHADSRDLLRRPDLCPDDRFDELVAWRPVDMRALPGDLEGFDLAWSSCCFEHLGTLEAGFDFVTASLDALVPGGIAIHTTELNLSSDDDTVTEGPTVLYRRRDLEAFVVRTEAAGHQVAALDLRPGDGVLDEFVDVPPYVDEPHIRVALRQHVTTSVALVVRKAG